MPAGETFAALAMADAVAASLERNGIAAVVAVGDCSPAAAALSARFSKSAQIRAILGLCSRVAPRLLGVQVPRELNVDADRLSHPSMATAVAADALAAGLSVVWLQTSVEALRVLTAACHLPLGGDDADG